MDLIILIILIGIVIFTFKKFSSFIYFFAIVDIFLRILTFIRLNINLPELSNFIAKYIPVSIPNIIDKYSTGILNSVLMWGYVICFIIFEYYIICFFAKKRK